MFIDYFYTVANYEVTETVESKTMESKDPLYKHGVGLGLPKTAVQ